MDEQVEGVREPGGRTSVVYVVDGEDRLREVNDAWLEFARGNLAPDLTAERILGRPLREFIADAHTWSVYQRFLNEARASGHVQRLPFRCDAPDLRRFMELEIAPSPDGSVRFTGRLIREEARPAVALFDSAAERSSELLLVCSWCKCVETADGWLEVEDAAETLGLFGLGPLPRLTHGICPACTGSFESLSYDR